jgi:ribosomal protein S18 acetylase RimI-like enzyme
MGQRMPARSRYNWIGENDAVRLRDAVAADVDPIVALVDSAYRGDSSRAGWTTEADLLDGQRTDVAAVAALIGVDGSRVLLGVDDDRLVACCHLERRDDGVCYFGMFAVSPTAQGSGFGRSMLTEAERLAQDAWGSTSMQMTVITQRRDLIDWYIRCGYHSTGEYREFPYGDERFGVPRRDDLRFEVLEKSLGV